MAAITTSSKRRWAVVIKQPSRGALALKHAGRQGFCCFNPLIKDKGKVEDLFPGYFFVDMDTEQRWHALLSTVGVADVIRAAGVPSLMAHHEIERIQSNLGPDGYYILAPKPRFMQRQQVRVETARGRHSFEGQLGIYAGMLPKERCEVLFGLVPVSIKESDLIAA